MGRTAAANVYLSTCTFGLLLILIYSELARGLNPYFKVEYHEWLGRCFVAAKYQRTYRQMVYCAGLRWRICALIKYLCITWESAFISTNWQWHTLLALWLEFCNQVCAIQLADIIVGVADVDVFDLNSNDRRTVGPPHAVYILRLFQFKHGLRINEIYSIPVFRVVRSPNLVNIVCSSAIKRWYNISFKGCLNSSHRDAPRQACFKERLHSPCDSKSSLLPLEKATSASED